ncbi:MAG: hypothetical protein JWR68_580 [Polaromonas sp.]|nr:hypothetical protein [Polaromonas sp.]
MQPMDRTQDPLEKQFLEGLTQGQLLIPICGACHKKHWYPRPICPFCRQPVNQFEVSRGRGEVYALTLMHVKDQPSQCIAYVTLDDEITLLASLSGEQLTRACIGQKVELDIASSRAKASLVFKLMNSEKLNSDD